MSDEKFIDEQEMPTLLGAIRNAVDDRRAVSADPVLIDLGCGGNPLEGFLGVDFAHPNADLRVDLFKPREGERRYEWPWGDSSVDVFYSSHFLEHVPDWDAFWRELYRCIKPGGYVIATTPYWSSVRAFQDPDHKQAISEERYSYLSRKWRTKFGTDHYSSGVDFELHGMPFYDIHDDFKDKSIATILYSKDHMINVVRDISVVLKAIKD